MFLNLFSVGFESNRC